MVILVDDLWWSQDGDGASILDLLAAFDMSGRNCAQLVYILLSSS